MYEKKKKLQNLLLMAIDAASVVLSYLLANWIYLSIRHVANFDMQIAVGNLWLVFLTYFCVFIFFNMNQYLLRRDNYEELVYILKVDIFLAAMMAMIFFAAKQTYFLARGVWAMTCLFNIPIMYAGHLAAKSMMRRQRRGKASSHMLLVTTTDRVERVLKRFEENKGEQGYTISIAILDADEIGKTYRGVPVVANKDNLHEVAVKEIVDEVYLNILYSSKDEVETYVEEFAKMGVTVHLNINVLEDMEGFDQNISRLGSYPAVSFTPVSLDYNKLVMKRIIDIIGGIVGLMLTGILMIFLAPAIKLDSRGPLFFKQKRVGRNGRYFYIYKFRSMYQDAEERKASLMAQNEMKGAMFKMTDDPRVTRVGKFIRATSLDEFPQFWNVLKGDMSLVGTRPPTVDEFKEYEGRHKRRLSMKPGLTGMWQVSGRSNIEDFEEVVRLDCFYIDNWSLQLDAKILLKTIVVVLKKVGSK